jgi:hypothetical protein
VKLVIDFNSAADMPLPKYADENSSQNATKAEEAEEDTTADRMMLKGFKD